MEETMSENQLQKTEINKQVEDQMKKTGMVETVRKTIFPGSTNDELTLYFYQCIVSGVHPLSKKIIPQKFKDNDGSFKVSFVTTVDHARSKAEETQLYDGQDAYQFEGELIVNHNGKEIKVPEKAIVKVYKKGVSRPFVGEARWVEFFPGEKRGFKYLQMPYHMLGKCAEMNALRKAFPDQLHNLYSEEEMLGVIENLANTSSTGSTKPNVTESDVTVEEGDGENAPTEEQRSQMKLISDKQVYFLLGECKKHKVTPESIANYAKVKSINWLTWNKQANVNFEKILKTVQEKPEFFAKYQPKPQEKKKPVKEENLPEVMGDEDFLQTAKALAESAGMSDIQLNSHLEAEFSFKDLESVPADSQSNVIDWLTSLQEQAGA
jgi:phage recombination protein Bet